MSLYEQLRTAQDLTFGFSVITGLVKENWDKEHPGMVKVEYFLGTKGKNVSGWVPVAMPYAFKDAGSYFLPEIGTVVLLAFEMGNSNCPVVIGSLWNQKNTIPQETANEKNTIKRVKTKGGSEVIFNDEDGKESIEIHTKKGLKIKLDDEQEELLVIDKESKNGVDIKMKDGTVQVLADQKLIFSVGGKDALILDGSGGKATLKMDQVQVEAGNSLQMKGGSTKLEGTSLELKGKSSTKLASDAITSIDGKMVKIC